MRQRLIWLAIVGGAAFYVFAFFVDNETSLGRMLRLTTIETGLATGISVVTTMAIGLGIINLLSVHGANILKRKQDWPLSVVVFVTFFMVVAFLLWQHRIDSRGRALDAEVQTALAAYREAFELDDPVARDRALGAMDPEDLELANRYYAYQATYRFEPQKFYLEYFINALAPTVMSLLGFYITYAAYRAFRIRSLEATVMMLAAAIVILGSDAIGGWISSVLNAAFGGREIIWLPHWADLGNRVMNSGMERGLAIGIGVAVIAVSLRILLGFEKGLTEVRTAET